MNRFEKHLSAMTAVICATLLVVFPAFVTAQETGDALEGVSLGELLNIKYIETATKHLMEARKAPAIATVITADEIRNMGARNIMDVCVNLRPENGRTLCGNIPCMIYS